MASGGGGGDKPQDYIYHKDWSRLYLKDYQLPLCILQLDTADRAVLKIAGQSHSIQLCLLTSAIIHVIQSSFNELYCRRIHDVIT